LLHTGRLRAQFYAGDVFNLSGSEIIFLLLAGLVVLGPERLPGVIRNVGRVYGQIRRMAQGLENEIKETFAEPVSDLKKTAQDIRSGFGEVDTEPSPPMRPERSATPEEIAAQEAARTEEPS
jgi:sec-independent protein translocase protein TatB